ncbi:MAG: hypothetical protein ACXW1F_08385 [Halobacteriota archaeon]
MEVENSQSQFAVCTDNTAYPDDLTVRTVYQVLPDESAARSNYLRILDETGEDYLYPADLFVMIDVTTGARLIRRPDGDVLLQAPGDALPMTPDNIKRMLEDLP